MSDGLVKILDGNTFVVSDQAGDIEASSTDPTGLFSFDTRFLSTWRLTLDGKRLTPLSVDDLQYFEAKFFLVPDTGTVYTDSEVSVIRQRTLGAGLREELAVLNHAEQDVDLTLRLDIGSDFADLFEVKDALAKTGGYARRVEDGKLIQAYERDAFRRQIVVSTSAPGEVDEDGITFALRLGPGDQWGTRLDVAMVVPNPFGASATRMWPPSVTGANGAGTSSAGSPTRRTWSATTSSCATPTGAAWSTSPRCGSRRPSRVSTACPPPACPGSCPCSGATAS